MPQLELPSKALHSGFELPKVEQEDDILAIADQRLSVAYGLAIAEFGLLLPLQEQSRIIDEFQLCQLPTAKGHLLGVSSIDGNTVPVFDLHALLELPLPSTKSNKQLLVVGTGEEAVGFIVSQSPTQVDLDQAIKIEGIPPNASSVEGNCYQLLSPGSLLA